MLASMTSILPLMKASWSHHAPAVGKRSHHRDWLLHTRKGNYGLYGNTDRHAGAFRSSFDPWEIHSRTKS